MSINGSIKAIAATFVAFVLLVFFFGTTVLNAALSSTGMSFTTSLNLNLSAADVHGSARLTRPERDAAVKLCITKVVNAPISGGATRINLSGSITEIKKKRAEQAVPACDCVVNQVEDRSSKMQFLMVMDAVAQNNVLFGRHRLPDFSRFWKEAKKHGMREGDFHAAAAQIDRIVASSLDTCSKHLSGN